MLADECWPDTLHSAAYVWDKDMVKKPFEEDAQNKIEEEFHRYKKDAYRSREKKALSYSDLCWWKCQPMTMS
jgi:hypothetical protein